MTVPLTQNPITEETVKIQDQAEASKDDLDILEKAKFKRGTKYNKNTDFQFQVKLLLICILF